MMMPATGLAVDYKNKNIAKRRTIKTIYYLYSTIYFWFVVLIFIWFKKSKFQQLVPAYPKHDLPSHPTEK